MSWLKRRDAEQQRAVIRNLTEHNKQLWEQLTAATKDIGRLTGQVTLLRAELERHGVKVYDVH